MTTQATNTYESGLNVCLGLDGNRTQFLHNARRTRVSNATTAELVIALWPSTSKKMRVRDMHTEAYASHK